MQYSNVSLTGFLRKKNLESIWPTLDTLTASLISIFDTSLYSPKSIKRLARSSSVLLKFYSKVSVIKQIAFAFLFF